MTDKEQQHPLSSLSSCESGKNPCQSCRCTETSSNKVGRWQFMRTALGTVAVLWGGVALYPIYRYLAPRPDTSDDETQVTSVEVCKLSELPKNSGKNFRFGSFPALLIHTEDDGLHAFKAVCTHLGCTVQYRGDIQRIFCACHGGQYDPTTGKNIAGPPPKPLDSLKVAVVNDQVVVSRA